MYGAYIMSSKSKNENKKDEIAISMIDAYFDGVNASISHIFNNLKLTNEVSGILVQSISEFASIFADTAKSVQDDLAKTLSNTASPMDLNSLGQSQQRAMETALRRCVEMSNRSMKLGQDMLSKISDASTDALSKAKSSS
jgi:hypothetical protein